MPLLAFWARPPRGLIELAADRAPGMVPFLNNLALLPWNFDFARSGLFLAGGVYLTLALMRHSTGWALAAALAANCALWATWAHLGLDSSAIRRSGSSRWDSSFSWPNTSNVIGSSLNWRRRCVTWAFV